MKIKIPNRIYGVTELYDTVARIMGCDDVSELNYDCREITVAPNIQDNFFKHYRNDNIEISETDFNMSVATLLLNYGPKIDETLQDYEVEVFNGFIMEV